MEKVNKILKMLDDRKGFSNWFDDIDEDLKNEIKDDIRKIIEE